MITGYTFAVDALKSLVLTLAVMDKYISVEKAVQLSRLEMNFQVNFYMSISIDLHLTLTFLR